MGYMIKLGEGYWVKRTARFGAFHGEIYITDNRADALIFTRKSDANSRADILAYRLERHEQDARKFAIRGLTVDDIRVVDTIEE